MSIVKPIKCYVRDFYKITYTQCYNQHFNNESCILFHEESEDLNNTNIIEIGTVFGVKVLLCWGTINGFTGIDFMHKDFNKDLTTFFRDVIKSDNTLDFLRILTYEMIPVSFYINEIIDEFPLLKE